MLFSESVRHRRTESRDVSESVVSRSTRDVRNGAETDIPISRIQQLVARRGQPIDTVRSPQYGFRQDLVGKADMRREMVTMSRL